MKVNHSTIISSVEFNNGNSVSVGGEIFGWGGVVLSINMGMHGDMVECVMHDGDEGYGVYFNEDGDEISYNDFE